MSRILFQLHVDIDARVSSIRSAHADWLCGKGCDSCCQRLASIPLLVAEEWNLLREGLAALPETQLAEISQRMVVLATQQARPFTCPFLDRESGACPVYVQRPVACRTYGFYVQRALGLYCGDIEAQVARGERDDVVWGNQDAIDHALENLGERRELTEWFTLWRTGTAAAQG